MPVLRIGKDKSETLGLLLSLSGIPRLLGSATPPMFPPNLRRVRGWTTKARTKGKRHWTNAVARRRRRNQIARQSRRVNRLRRAA